MGVLCVPPCSLDKVANPTRTGDAISPRVADSYSKKRRNNADRGPLHSHVAPRRFFYAARSLRDGAIFNTGTGIRLACGLSDFGTSSLGQIPSPAFMRNTIPPSVTDENSERKAKDQNGIDHQVEHDTHP